MAGRPRHELAADHAAGTRWHEDRTIHGWRPLRCHDPKRGHQIHDTQERMDQLQLGPLVGGLVSQCFPLYVSQILNNHDFRVRLG